MDVKCIIWYDMKYYGALPSLLCCRFKDTKQAPPLARISLLTVERSTSLRMRCCILFSGLLTISNRAALWWKFKWLLAIFTLETIDKQERISGGTFDKSVLDRLRDVRGEDGWISNKKASIWWCCSLHCWRLRVWRWIAPEQSEAGLSSERLV